jgi:molybdate transport system substrate-binding protein
MVGVRIVRSALGVTVLVALAMHGRSTSAAEISVMSGGAPQEVLTALTPQFEKQTGHRVRYSFAVITALRHRLDAGERADLLIMPTTVIDEYVAAGKMRSDERSTLGSIGMTVIVKQGASLPNISTPERFRQALLAARSIVHAPPSATPSGAHMAKVIEQLGIDDAVKNKVVYRAALNGGVNLVADGVADIGMYPATEVANVKGITLVGALPGALQVNVFYGAAVMADNTSPDAASSFVKFLADPANRQRWKKAGFEPPGG